MLVAWAEPMRHLSYDRKTRQQTFTSEMVLTANEISATLAAAVKKLTNPLYGVFEFFEAPLSIFEDVIAEMKGVENGVVVSSGVFPGAC